MNKQAGYFKLNSIVKWLDLQGQLLWYDTVSHLEGYAFIWWYQLACQGGNHELGILEWSESELKLVDAFVNVDSE